MSATQTAPKQQDEQLSALEMRERLPKGGDGSVELPFAHRAYICNITDINWPTVDFDYGRFAIVGCREGEAYRMTTITARISPMDHGDKNKTEVPIGALHIAHDLVRMTNENAGQVDQETGAVPFVGVFVCQGPKPTEQELTEAWGKLKQFCEHYVAVADMDFAQHRRSAWIPGFARRALKILKQERAEWAFTSVDMSECPMCTTKVLKRAAICPNCKFVLDPAKVKALEGEPAAEPLPELEAHEPGNTEQTGKAEKSRRSPSAGRSTKPDSHT
jgi:hypothetical protein